MAKGKRTAAERRDGRRAPAPAVSGPVFVPIAIYALLAAIVIPLFPHFISPNEFARWVLVVSLAEERTVDVTAPTALLGRPFEDLATIDGRLYSNKAPGAALVSLPAYLAARPFTGAANAANIRPVMTAMRMAASTLPLLLLAVAFARVATDLGAESGRRTRVVTILLFATPLFAYGLLLFSHALVAASLFGAWALLYARPQSRGADAAAGALVGLAVMAEYTAAIPAVVLLGGLLFQRSWQRILRVCIGGLPFAAGLAAYHFAAYGSPFGMPYGSDLNPEFRALAGRGLFGVGLPSVTHLGRLLFDPSRGLFLFSPVLLLSLAALAAAWRRLPRAAFWTLVLAPVSVILLHAGYPNWHGGWNVGPRYIVPAIPFLAALLLFGKGGKLESFLTGASILAVTMTALTFPFPPNDFIFPWATLGLPLLREGLIAPNLLHLAARPAALIVPFVLVAASTLAAFRRRDLLGLAAGAILMLAAGAAGGSSGSRVDMDAQRGYIVESLFERSGALRRLLPDRRVDVSDLEQRIRIERGSPPPSWPF